MGGILIVRLWLINIREKCKMTQEQVSIKAKVSRQFIGMLENNTKVNPHPNTAKRISEVLEFEKYGIDWTKFFEDEQQNIS